MTPEESRAVRTLAGMMGQQFLSASEIISRRPDLTAVFPSETSHGSVIMLGKILCEVAARSDLIPGIKVDHRKMKRKNRNVYRVTAVAIVPDDGSDPAEQVQAESCYNCLSAKRNTITGEVCCHHEPGKDCGFPSIDNWRDMGYQLLCARYRHGQDLSAHSRPPSPSPFGRDHSDE